MSKIVKYGDGGIGFLSLLTILFIYLKLSGSIYWGWFWILSPILIPVIIVVFILVIVVIAGLLNDWWRK
jgi:hypothetical protein